MGFFGELISATVKTALTPLAVVKDVVNVVTGEDIEATEKTVAGIIDNLENAVDELTDGNL